MRIVIYCLVMGLLILFSAPAQEAATEEHSGLAGLAGSVIPTPHQSITASLLGAALIGFVLLNAKRKEPLWCRATSFWKQ
jgi:hypothetical protein